MILHCETLEHPLLHNGTQQRDRLLISLVPDQLKLDDRSIEDLIAFAGTLSTHIRYWDESNQPAGDWLPFWESDNSSLFAILAATDLDGPRTQYRSKEIGYYTLKKKESQESNPGKDAGSADAINEMVANPVFGVYGLALLVLKICNKVPASHPLKADIIKIISSNLADPLYKLIQFHKAIDAQAIKKYAGFIGVTGCAAPWNLKDNAAFECIDFVMPYEFPDTLWKLFLVFYKALTMILEKLRKAFNSSLRTRKDHQPQITLFISFLQLFKHLQDDLNSLTGKHLLYYYHDILQLEKRRLIPDKVHLVFEIASNVVRHRIVNGTAFTAGADELGQSLTYTLTDELVISAAKLIERQNLSIKVLPADEGQKPVFQAIFLPAADKRDGFKEEWPAGAKAWHPLSGAPVVDRLRYKLDQLNNLADKMDASIPPRALVQEMNKVQASLDQLKAVSGFSISSMEFWLNTGFDRIISIEFTFERVPDFNMLDQFALELSTEKGLIQLKPYFEEIENTPPIPGSGTGVPESATPAIERIFFGENFAGVSGNPSDHEARNRVIKIKDTQRFLIVLNDAFPSVLPLEDGKPPFLRFRSLNNFDTPLSDINNIEIFSVSKGKLGVLKKSKPGILFRQLNQQEQSGDELVILSIDQEKVLLRIPELFGKELGNITVALPPLPLFVPANPNLEVLNADQWVAVPTGGELPPLIGLKETADPVQPPDQFNFTTLAHNPDGWLRIQFTIPDTKNIPNVLDAADMLIQYRSNKLDIPLVKNRSAKRHFISYFTSLGDWIADTSGNAALRPGPAVDEPQLNPILDECLMANEELEQPIANGNLFLGFENLTPDQTLPLLFETAEGTGNPDHYAPAISWSYLSNDQWIKIPPQFILKDETLGMQQTGIILFQVPADITNNNSWTKGADNRKDLYWLRASAHEIADDLLLLDALPLLKDIYVNAGEAVFADNNNTETHLINGILPQTISALTFSDVNVKSVTQPYASFDGRQSEQADPYAYLQRISERLRHKDRAVTIWDYERLVLQAFPTVDVVKCVPHTHRIYTVRPGHVTVAAIPFPDAMTGDRIFYPIFSAGALSTMKALLVKRNSYFVGGYADPAFCCCDDGCECGHNHDRIDVINARFEPIRLKLCIRFYQGKDIPFYTKQLNEDLKTFLSPWARGNKPLLFGVAISMTRLLRFLENLDYVDVVMGLELKHFPSRQAAENQGDLVPWTSPEMITPFTTVSVLTTYLDRLNEDNPNVIDHVINVIDVHDKCACQGCVERDCLAEGVAPPPVVPDPNAGDITNLRNQFHDIWKQQPATAKAVKEISADLDLLVDRGKLKGNKPVNAEKGVEGTDAYRIDKIKEATRIIALQLSVAFEAGKPFTIFHVNNPNT